MGNVLEVGSQTSEAPKSFIKDSLSSATFGFIIRLGAAGFIGVWPPRNGGSSLETWRVIGEAKDQWPEEIMDEFDHIADVDYVVITEGDFLDLDGLSRVTHDNFPGGGWPWSPLA